jgi:hypothetical protein
MSEDEIGVSLQEFADVDESNSVRGLRRMGESGGFG